MGTEEENYSDSMVIVYFMNNKWYWTAHNKFQNRLFAGVAHKKVTAEIAATDASFPNYDVLDSWTTNLAPKGR